MKQVRNMICGWGAGVVLVVAGGAAVYWGIQAVNNDGKKMQAGLNEAGEMVKMSVGDAELMVEVRDDEKGRELGLSGRESLGEDEGMLFVFDQPLRPTFWMKEMNFDLDMIWINEGEVMDISERVPAPTEKDPVLQTVTPKLPVTMVLEVNAGYVQKHGIELGDVAAVGD